MLDILATCLEDCEEISTQILDAVLENLVEPRKTERPAAVRLPPPRRPTSAPAYLRAGLPPRLLSPPPPRLLSPPPPPRPAPRFPPPTLTPRPHHGYAQYALAKAFIQRCASELQRSLHGFLQGCLPTSTAASAADESDLKDEWQTLLLELAAISADTVTYLLPQLEEVPTTRWRPPFPPPLARHVGAWERAIGGCLGAVAAQHAAEIGKDGEPWCDALRVMVYLRARAPPTPHPCCLYSPALACVLRWS